MRSWLASGDLHKEHIIIDCTRSRRVTHVRAGGITLEVRLDGLVLLVEQSQIRYEILDDVGVRQRVDARLGVGVGRDTAWTGLLAIVGAHTTRLSGCRGSSDIHKQARVLTPSMFMAQLPQIPSRQERRKVKVGSCSFFIRMRASSIIGPVLLRSRL